MDDYKEGDLKVGDIFRAKGPSMPPSWEQYHFRVKRIVDGEIALDGPFHDEQCKRKVDLSRVTEMPRPRL